MASKAALKQLQSEFKHLTKEPLEGVTISLENDDNLFRWHVGIFGPPDTPFCGGYFKALLTFPESYPYDPPKMKFLSEVWHPNVYKTGDICISILHPPGTDELSGERPEERWNPTQSVRTILLSVISMLNEPNTASPANVDASVTYRDWINGKSDVYVKRVKANVQHTQKVAEDEGVQIPLTMEEYVQKETEQAETNEDWTLDDLHDDSDYDYSDDEEEDEDYEEGDEGAEVDEDES